LNIIEKTESCQFIFSLTSLRILTVIQEVIQFFKVSDYNIFVGTLTDYS
jgi:hypothetical protein